MEYKEGDELGVIRCNHKYHKTCIDKWLETGGYNCPLCRCTIFNCEICLGSKYIYYDYTGTVIPLEHRGQFINRNATNGRYGIYAHDLEDLFIEEMMYDRTQKRLHLFISS